MLKTANAIVQSPNGSESLVTGTIFPVVYFTSGSTNNVRIQYSINDGASWSNVVSSTSGGVYNWTVPNNPSNTALVMVTDVSQSCNSDRSDTTFNILSSVEVVRPNGGETFTASVGAHGTNYNMSAAEVKTNNGHTDVTI